MDLAHNTELNDTNVPNDARMCYTLFSKIGSQSADERQRTKPLIKENTTALTGSLRSSHLFGFTSIWNYIS